MILNKIDSLLKYVFWARKLWHPGKYVAYLLGTPIHDNIGDSAIAIAEKQFLLQNGYECVVEITTADAWEYCRCISRLLPKNTVIYLHGGGNMGDQYKLEEILRRRIMQEFSGHPIVVFPQTIYYSDSQKGKQMERESITVYEQCADLTLIARDKTSYAKMREIYPSNRVFLLPDIVMSMKIGLCVNERTGVLLCFRNDSERKVSKAMNESLVNELKTCGQTIEVIDMIAEEMISVDLRDEVVGLHLKRFFGAKLIITDRLHGMIFAALTGTPCIVFSNYNHKVRETYEWIRYLPYIRFVECVEEVERLLPEMLAMKDCKYDNAPLQPEFEKLAAVIRENIDKQYNRRKK